MAGRHYWPGLARGGAAGRGGSKAAAAASDSDALDARQLSSLGRVAVAAG